MGAFTSLAGRALKKAARSAGKAIEHAVFGNLDDDDEKPAAPPDPFAKLKAAEAERKAREREARKK